MKNIAEMTKDEFELVNKFKLEHEITNPVGAANFIWNAQEWRFQVAEVLVLPNPFTFNS
jgi:hypothetical protein